MTTRHRSAADERLRALPDETLAELHKSPHRTGAWRARIAWPPGMPHEHLPVAFTHATRGQPDEAMRVCAQRIRLRFSSPEHWGLMPVDQDRLLRHWESRVGCAAEARSATAQSLLDEFLAVGEADGVLRGRLDYVAPDMLPRLRRLSEVARAAEESPAAP